MKRLPRWWTNRPARDAETEVRRLKRRFERVSGRYFRASKLGAWYRTAAMAVGLAFGTFALCSWLLRDTRSATPATLLNVSFIPNCATARALGIAPIRRGEPGYAAHLDRDNDGVACEPYRVR